MPASDPGIRVLTPPPSSGAEILEPAALQFLGALARRFEPERQRRLVRRRERQQELDAGRLPDFLPETKQIRDSDWTVAPIRPDLTDRRVEITGPPERKMMINALNSGANVFMADFEDANAPTWENNLRGQQNVRDAVARTIAYTSPEGKRYALEPKTATLVVRPRGWHLVEKHLVVDGQPIAASLFDFGLTFFHTAAALVASGSGPYFYLPKLESHLEARLWNDVFVFAQEALAIPRGTIRATVLIETILAAFETDEILWELRDHSAGLNCGRWDYIFSYIKKLRRRPECVLPDRARVTMEHAFRPAAQLLDVAEDVIPAPAVEPGRMVAQLPQDLVRLEGGENRLDQHRRADRATRNPERILREDEDVVPQTRLEMDFELREIEEGSRAACGELGRSMEKGESEIEERRRNRLPVHGQVLLDQVPPAGPHDERRGLGLERVAFPLGTGVRDGAGDRVAHVLLARQVVLPRGC